MLDMEWTRSLKKAKGLFENGEMTHIKTTDEAARYLTYFDDQFRMDEEEMTFDQAERVEKQLNDLFDCMKKLYPGLGRTDRGEFVNEDEPEGSEEPAAKSSDTNMILHFTNKHAGADDLKNTFVIISTDMTQGELGALVLEIADIKEHADWGEDLSEFDIPDGWDSYSFEQKILSVCRHMSEYVGRFTVLGTSRMIGTEVY